MIEGAWYDGICNSCGSEIEEKGSDRIGSDYMNRCVDVGCVEHKWHYCFDTEFLPYYTHKEEAKT